MQILLICKNQVGSSAFPAETIEGLPVSARRYVIEDGRVVLSGYPDAVLHHDAEELLKNPLFHMPTPAEQEEMATEQAKAGQIQEETPATSEKLATDPGPESLLSLSTKKKTSGG